MKYRTPISMFNVFKTSNRKTTQMVTPTPDIQYVYNASITWNWARQVLNLILTLVTFLFHLQMQKLYLRITYFCLKKWAILVSGISTGTSWCCFDFLWNLSKSLNKTNMIEKNLICCYHRPQHWSWALWPSKHTHNEAINDKIFPKHHSLILLFSSG